jgi:succinate dehydrogenase flavin-adding protein (antitoxin of CptAB toxin-antitoxin module)
MRTFGELKTKLLTKITESYTSKNKNEVKDLVKKMKSNKSLVEMYMFYEGIEYLNINDKEKAKLYVESIEPILIEKITNLKKDIKEFGKIVKDVVVENNELYSVLDILSEENNIGNISKKIDARESLVNHLIIEKKKEVVETPSVQIENHTLLNTVLVNNFNIKYSDFLNEEQKEIFNKIISMSDNELNTEIKNVKEELVGKLNTLLNESTDIQTQNKLKSVLNEVVNSENTKYQYYKLNDLKNGLI